MAVSSQITKTVYQSDGVTREWYFSFPCLSDDHIKLYITNADGADTQILSTNFTVDTVNGVLTYPIEGSPLETGYKVTVIRELPLVQELDLENQGELDAEELEKAYDYLTMIVQQLNERLDRTIQSSVAATDGETWSDLVNNFLASSDTVKALVAQAEKASSDALKIAYDGVDIGSPALFMTGTAPDCYLLMDGSDFNKETYPELFAVLGTNTLPDWTEQSTNGKDGYKWYVKALHRTNITGTASELDVKIEACDEGESASASYDSDSNTITFKLPSGAQGEKGPVGDKGPQGDKGPAGDAGWSPVGLAIYGFELRSDGHLLFKATDNDTDSDISARMASNGHVYLDIEEA